MRYNLFPEPDTPVKSQESEQTRSVYSQILQNELWGTTLLKEKPTGFEIEVTFSFSSSLFNNLF